MEKREKKQQVIRAGKELSDTGLIARTWGNVSCRLDDDHFLITASGKNYRTLTEEEVVTVSLADLSYTGDIRPSSEMKVHRAVYEQKAAGFVIHTHQEWACAVSAMGRDEVRFDRIWPGIGDTVLCADYALPGTQQLCSNTQQVLKQAQGNAVILRNHGALCWGSTYEEAFQAAWNLEAACSAYLEQLEPEIFQAPKEEPKQIGNRILWDRSRILLAFAEEKKEMRPYLDDFAQIAGKKLRVLPKNQKAAEKAVSRGKSVIVRGIGAFSTADTLSDAEALSSIVIKNAMAYFAARAAGEKPLGRRDCRKMRRHYVRQYSKLQDQ